MSEGMFAAIVTGGLLLALVVWVPFLHVCHKTLRREEPKGEDRTPLGAGSLAVD